MRSPSARVLKNRADIYVSISGRDNDGGVTFPYPVTPTISQEPCSAQAMAFYEDVGQDGRITMVTEWKLIFADSITVSPRDKIVTVDPLGVVRTLYVEAGRDNAGRDSAFTVSAIERV